MNGTVKEGEKRKKDKHVKISFNDLEC